MQLNLYRNNSEPNKVGKSLTSLLSLNGTLREQTSIINPTITIETSGPILANYAYIPQFQRYYFITDIESVKEGLWSISMRCDVLESFKNQIGENEAILARQEKLFNLYLKDDLATFSSESFTLYKEFPKNAFTGGFYCLITNG